MEKDLAQGGAAFRDRFRLVPYHRVTATRSATHTSTPGGIENVFRYPMVGWPAREVVFPSGNLRTPPGNPPMRCAFDGLSPLHVFGRGPA